MARLQAAASRVAEASIDRAILFTGPPRGKHGGPVSACLKGGYSTGAVEPGQGDQLDGGRRAIGVWTAHLEALERLAGAVGEFEAGTVALVGAGPGDSTLISVRGAVRLSQADVILHDLLVGPELLDITRPDAERVFVGKWRGQHAWSQDEINAALIRHARAGKRVVRLKGGDPFVFGRGGEECLRLAQAGIRYEVVPGITAASGAPATAGIPLTHRGLSRSLALVTGHAEPDDPHPPDYAALARMETVVFYMGLKNIEENCQGLIEAGLSAGTPAAVIHWGTRPQQRTIVGTLGDIADRAEEVDELGSPAMVVIGQTVRLRESIEWFERRPLFGRTVVITRAPDQAGALAGALAAAGAEVIEAPTIEIAELDDYWSVDQALRSIAQYSWLVLTSLNGVDALWDRLEAVGGDARALGGVRVAAVGAATAGRLLERGVRADLVPGEAVGDVLAETLAQRGVRGQRVLLLRADLGRPQLPQALREAGAVCDDLPIYRTVCPESLPGGFLEAFDAGRIDWIALTSPSSFVNLLRLIGRERAERLRAIKLAGIGPVTTRAIRQAGYVESAEANSHDVAGLVAAIVAAAGRH